MRIVSTMLWTHGKVKFGRVFGVNSWKVRHSVYVGGTNHLQPVNLMYNFYREVYITVINGERNRVRLGAENLERNNVY